MSRRRSSAAKVLEKIWDGADAQETLKIDGYAHLVGGCRMGFTPDDSVVDSSHRAWEVPNLFAGADALDRADARVRGPAGAAEAGQEQVARGTRRRAPRTDAPARRPSGDRVSSLRRGAGIRTQRAACGAKDQHEEVASKIKKLSSDSKPGG